MHRPKSFANLEIGLQSLTRRQLEHHLRLYLDDVGRLNALDEELQALRVDGRDGSAGSAAGRGAMRQREPALHNGVLLHELYFEALGHDDRLSPELDAALQASGGRERVLAELRAAALGGIGWTLLLWDRLKGALRVLWVREDQVIVPLGHDVLFALDGWEHAYFTDYGPERDAYLTAVLRDLSWPVLSRRLTAAQHVP